MCLTASFLATGGFKFNYFKMHAWSTSVLILNTLLLLHSAFMPSVVKMPVKGEVGGCALNSHGNNIVDLTWNTMEKSWNCVFNFCVNMHRFALLYTCGGESRCTLLSRMK